MKTYIVKASEIKRERRYIDASGETLGRLATRIAILLMGKHKPGYAPNLDCGDIVVVTNADKVRLTKGKRTEQKVYYWHSGYPGGLKSITFDKLMATHPTRALKYAVQGMLPHNRLGTHMLKKLEIYAGDALPGALKKAKPKLEKTVEALKEGASPNDKK